MSDQGSVSAEEWDQEWVELLKEARDLGITPEEIKQFLQENRVNSKTA